MIRISPSDYGLIKNLSEDIAKVLDSVGLFYRIFYRAKSVESINRKLGEKKNKYGAHGKRMQDVFGIRITLYFFDDEKIAIKLIKSKFTELTGDRSIDTFDKDKFGPQRKNFIFKLPETIINRSLIFQNENIDSTFEVQFRTVFSEGWHEIEHDLRYKCAADWEDEDILNRMLNSQAAVLESCDWTIKKILEELAYKKYKTQNWNSFFKNIIRIRFHDQEFSPNIIKFLNKNKELARNILKRDRTELLPCLANVAQYNLPLKMDNVLFVINRFELKNDELKEKEQNAIRDLLNHSEAGLIRINTAAADVLEDIRGN